MKKHFSIIMFLSTMLFCHIAVGQVEPATLPYSCDFENVMENANWMLVNDTLPNKFFIGNAVNNGGNNSLYISNTPTGTTNEYSLSSCTVYAYRTINASLSGKYSFSFDWKVQGESPWDLARVALVHDSVIITSSTSLPANNLLASNLPDNWIAIDGGTKLDTTTNWKRFYSDEIEINAGTYKLVFIWRNDNHTIINPPIAIDNISIKYVSCQKVSNIIASSITNNTANIKWNTNGDITTSGYLIEYGIEGFAPGEGVQLYSTDTNISLSNLQQNTTYDLYVRPICSSDSGLLSNPIHIHTLCDFIDVSVLPYIETFSTYSATTQTTAACPTNEMPPCWDIYTNGTKGLSEEYYPRIYKGNSSPTKDDNCLLLPIYTATNTSTSAVLQRGSEKGAYLPVFTDSLRNLILSFDAKFTVSNATYIDTLFVVVKRATDATYNTLATYTSNMTNLSVELNLNNYASILDTITNGRLGFVFKGGRGFPYTGIVGIDNVKVEKPSSCPKPQDARMTIGYNSITISFNDSTHSNNYKIIWDTINDIRLAANTTNFSDTHYTITNLLPNTTYHAWISTICSDSHSQYVELRNIRTGCSPIDNNELPYQENFGNWTSSNYNNCYIIGNSSQENTNYPRVEGARDARSIYMYSTTEYASWFALPIFDTNIYNLQVSFDLRKNNSNDEYPLIVGIMHNPYDISHFDTITTVNCINSDTWERFNIALTNYNGDGLYIAFISPDGVTSGNYLDNIVVDYIPSCPDPLNITIDSINSESVTLSWEETGICNYVMEYGLTGFVRGSGGGHSMYTYENSITIQGLRPVKTYDFYLRSDCSETDTGNWIGPISFLTPCPSIFDLFTIDYIEDFDDYSASNYELPHCWSFYTNGTNGHTQSAYPRICKGQTGAPNTNSNYLQMGIMNYTGTGTTYLDNSVKIGSMKIAILPLFNEDLNNITISFDARISNSYNDTLFVAVATSDSTYIPITYFTSPSELIEANINLSEYSYIFDTIQIENPRLAFAFKASTASSATTRYVGIDNIIISRNPLCKNPDNGYISSYTNNSATFIVFDSAHINNYEIAWSRVNDITLIEQTNTYTDTTGVIIGLSSNTTYYAWARAVCNEENSRWISIGNFKTFCDPISSFPYIEDFESYTIGTNGTFNECWIKGTNHSTAYPYVSTTDNVNSQFLYLYGDKDHYSYISLPMVNQPINTMKLNFSLNKYSNNTPNLFIGIMPYPHDIESFVVIDSAICPYTLESNQWTNFEISFENYNGPEGYITFMAKNGFIHPDSTNHVRLDSIQIDLLPNCRKSINLTASNISSHSATLNWTNTTGDSYVIAYSKTANFTPDTCSSLATTIVDSVNITGLQSYTTYYYTVQSICGTDTGEWSNISSFTTLNDCGTIYNIESKDIAIEDTSISTASSMLPIFTHSSYPQDVRGCSWQIYTLEELKQQGVNSGNINGIAFQYISEIPTTANIKVYISEVTYDRFGSGYDTIPYYQMKCVYNGNITFSNNEEWSPIIFDTPFYYSGKRNLVIAIDRTGSYSFSGSFKYTTIEGEYLRSNYKTIAACWGGDGMSDLGTRSERNNIRFNICNVDSICVCPTNIVVNNIQPTQVDVSWTHSDGYNFTVAYGPHGFNLGNSATYQTVVTTSRNIVLTDLSQSTTYDVYVRATCADSNSVSDWSSAETFTTYCTPVSTPYTENFDSYASEMIYSTSYPYHSQTLPRCWTFLNMSENWESTAWLDNNSNSENGICLVLEAKTNSSIYGILPQMNENIETLKISFTYYNHGLTSRGDDILSIGVISDILDSNSFIELESFPITFVERRIQHSFALDTIISGNNYHIAFRCKKRNVYQIANIDNIVVEHSSPCMPFNVSVNNITGTTAEITCESNGASSWIIEYGPTGFELSEGIMVSTNNIPHTLTNLAPSTVYDVYVRSICNNGDTSEVQFNTCTFSTLCDVVSLPWDADLDGIWLQDTNNAPALFPTCWNVINGENNQYYWCNDQSGTNTRTGTTSIKFEGYIATSPTIHHNDWLITPEIRLTGNDQLSFWLKNISKNSLSSNTSRLSIYIYYTNVNDSTISISNFVQLSPRIDFFGYTNYQKVIIPIIGNGGNARLAFVVDTNCQSFYIDDITIESCPTPELTIDSVSQTTVSLSWNSNANDFIVEYKKFGDNVWRTYLVSQNRITIQNLSPSSNYQFRVKAICSANDSSRWSNIVDTVTLCGVTELPFFEDFTSISFPNYCWKSFDGIAFSNSYRELFSPFIRREETYGFQSPHAKINIYGTSCNEWLVTPEIDLSATTNAKLSFDIALTKYNSNDTIDNESTYDDKFMVIVSTDNGTTWLEANATIWSDDTSVNSNYSYRGISNSGEHIVIDLSQYYGDTIRIGFYGESSISGGDNEVHIDNIVVQSTCPNPIITAISTDATTAIVEWFPNYGNFQIAYKDNSSNTWSSEINVTDTSTYTISGLAPETSYQVRVRTVCEDSIYSRWVESSFSTTERPCITPNNIMATNISYTSATISWNDSLNNQIEWYVEYGYNENKDTLTTTTTSIDLINLYIGTNYSVKVQGRCSADAFSDWSEEYTFHTNICETISDISVGDITNSSAIISWNTNGHESKWEITYCRANDFSTIDDIDIIVDIENNPIHTIEGLDSNTIYYLYIRTICEEGIYSEWSERIVFTTTEEECNPVSNVTANDITESGATITWTAAGNETKWQVAYCLASDAIIVGEDATVVAIENTPSYTITGLESRTSYDAFVRTVCNEVNHSAWTKINFTTDGIGINTAAGDNVNIRIYPNPANTEATIAVDGINGKVEFAIADMNGRMIVTETINCDGQLVKTIDVSNLAKGAYFVHIYNDNFNTTRKLIVK